jgi:hypothetical protein
MYYLQVLPQLLVIIKHKESVDVAQFELVFLYKLEYLNPHGPPHSGVFVQIKVLTAIQVKSKTLLETFFI